MSQSPSQRRRRPRTAASAAGRPDRRPRSFPPAWDGPLSAVIHRLIPSSSTEPGRCDRARESEPVVSRETAPRRLRTGAHRGRPRGRPTPASTTTAPRWPGPPSTSCWPGRAPGCDRRCRVRTATRVIVVANQKGGVGKTTTHGEHRRRARPARAAGAGRSTSTRRATPPRRSASSTAAACRRRTTRSSTARRSPRWSAECPEVAGPVRGARHHRPGRRRDRAGQRGGPREPAAQGDRGASRGSAARRRRGRTASTTSSSTARRRWACSR